MLDGLLPVDGLVDRLLQRHRLAAAELPVGGDDQLGLGVLDPGRQGRRREPREDHGMQHAEARAGQHRDDRLRDHRHVDGDAVAGDQAEVREGVGGLGHLGLEFGVGQRAAVADRLALPQDRHPVAIACLDVAVNAVVGDVELAADEPLGHRCLGPVQHLVERGVPGQPVGLFRPERQPILLGLAVQLSGRIGLRGEVVGRRISGQTFGVVIGHICEPSHPAIASTLPCSASQAGYPLRRH